MPLKILCFGDSNTWGYVPGSWNAELGTCDRHAESIRWPNLLSSALERRGISCAMVEDAVPGRTIDIEHPDDIALNGKASIEKNHLFVLSDYNVIIIVLGVNDLKSVYKRTAKEIQESFLKLVKFIKQTSPLTEIILCSPPKITKEDGFGEDFAGAAPKSEELRKLLLKFKENNLCHIMQLKYDLNDIDGVHFSIEDNARLAKGLDAQLQLLFDHTTEKQGAKKPTPQMSCK